MNKKILRAEKKAALDAIMTEVRVARATKNIRDHVLLLNKALIYTSSRNLRAEYSRVWIKLVVEAGATKIGA